MKSLLPAILAAALLAGPAAAAGDCPVASPRAIVERFLSADCERCWQAAAPAERDAFVLDWIVPGAHGADAPLAVAAVPEASERAARSGPLGADEPMRRAQTLPVPGALQVQVLDGPALNGYIGLQMGVRQRDRRPLAAGLVGYIALIERVAAGSEGNASERRLVRTLIGPFPLLGLAPGRPAVELRATSYPENAKPDRLTAVGWVEDASGRTLATGSAPYAGCGTRRVAGTVARLE